MSMNDKILLLGATGRTGKLVLENALEKGYHVHCLGRDIKRIAKQPGIELFEGDSRSYDDLHIAMEGCKHVITTLNISRVNDFPWSSLTTPETYLSETMLNISNVASKHNLVRIVCCSAWGVSESRIDIPWWFRWTIENSNINAAYIDHERQEEVLKRSALMWTIVRPVGLTNGKSIQKIRETFGVTPQPSLTINRISVASYLVDALNNERVSKKMIVISSN
ncbi:MAG: hypothetical protein ACI9A7_001794 [Cyclobacteriaceae bacterium]|jgi:uncharacterized protein YbjT (DUF2867 family)